MDWVIGSTLYPIVETGASAGWRHGKRWRHGECWYETTQSGSRLTVPAAELPDRLDGSQDHTPDTAGSDRVGRSGCLLWYSQLFLRPLGGRLHSRRLPSGSRGAAIHRIATVGYSTLFLQKTIECAHQVKPAAHPSGSLRFFCSSSSSLSASSRTCIRAASW